MKLVALGCIYGFIFISTVLGVPLEMNVSGISQAGTRTSYLTSHESLIRLMKGSELTLHCEDETKKVCVRPIDYSHVKPNIPFELEACHSQQVLPRCDDLMMELSFKSRDLLKIGLRL